MYKVSFKSVGPAPKQHFLFEIVWVYAVYQVFQVNYFVIRCISTVFRIPNFCYLERQNYGYSEFMCPNERF